MWIRVCVRQAVSFTALSIGALAVAGFILVCCVAGPTALECASGCLEASAFRSPSVIAQSGSAACARMKAA